MAAQGYTNAADMSPPKTSKTNKISVNCLPQSCDGEKLRDGTHREVSKPPHKPLADAEDSDPDEDKTNGFDKSKACERGSDGSSPIRQGAEYAAAAMVYSQPPEAVANTFMDVTPDVQARMLSSRLFQTHSGAVYRKRAPQRHPLSLGMPLGIESREAPCPACAPDAMVLVHFQPTPPYAPTDVSANGPCETTVFSSRFQSRDA